MVGKVGIKFFFFLLKYPVLIPSLVYLWPATKMVRKSLKKTQKKQKTLFGGVSLDGVGLSVTHNLFCLIITILKNKLVVKKIRNSPYRSISFLTWYFR